VAAVYTQPPRPAGRGMSERNRPCTLSPTARHSRRDPKTLKDEADQRAFAEHRADVARRGGLRLDLPQARPAGPKHGCLNLHASALPRWRGAAPIQRAIMAGDTETAATVMRMDVGLDTGPICLEERVPIEPDMTAGELHDLLAGRGARLMSRALANLERSTLQCRAQPSEGITYAAKIGRDDGRIDFDRPAGEVHNHIRGLSPVPGAWFEVRSGDKPERVKVVRASLVKNQRAGLEAPGTVLDDRLNHCLWRGAPSASCRPSGPASGP
jgi:methionyl-tRNA formyltransferase